MKGIKIISAGAGSGKTYRLTEELYKIISEEGVDPKRVIATTFTKKAASELKERVRSKLIEKGESPLANKMESARIGTVNSVCGALIEKFAFEAGISPKLSIIAEEDESLIFNQSLSTLLEVDLIERMEEVTSFLGIDGEWRDVVRDIVKRARANSIKDLSESEKESLKFMEFLPSEEKVDIGKLNQKIKTAIDGAVKVLLDSEKPPKGLLGDLKSLQRSFSRTPGMDNYRKLNNLSIAGKWQDSFGVLMEYNGNDFHERLPIFHQYIREYISTVYQVAQSALDAYRNFKEERGLIDFIDQEERLLELLDNDTVAHEIKNELDLLLVDEFQDTSPIQLAIFLKLSKLSAKSIWVGDPKQSIYGFRGADPSLMDACIEKLGGVKKEDILSHSYRSRKPLVEFANKIFLEAFGGEMPPEQIELSPKRKEKRGTIRPLLHYEFTPEGRKLKLPFDQLACEIVNLVESGQQIEDKSTGGLRPIEYSDIAVLSRTNPECSEIATALSEVGVKAKVNREGLRQCLEQMLLISSLGYINYPNSGLYQANIMYLISAKYSLESVVDKRLRSLEEGVDWTENNSYFEFLDGIREIANKLSPASLVQMVVDSEEFRREVSRFGNIELRMANVELCLERAFEVEKRCELFYLPCSLDGLLMELASFDDQAQSKEEGAVEVLTYHRSKGLEWPIVFNCSLNKGIHAGLYFGVKASSKNSIDISNPLRDRLIVFWPNVLGTKGTSYENITRSKRGQELYHKEVLERNRLLYVGLTRARECNIFPISAKEKPVWLTDACEGFSFDMMDTVESAGILQSKPKPGGPESWVKPSAGREDYDQKFISPSSVDLDSSDLKVGEIVEYSKRFSSKERVDDALYGDALHDILALQAEIRGERAEHVLDQYRVKDAVNPEELLAACRSFYDLVDTKFSPVECLYEVPLAYNNNGQIINGIADLILETSTGLVLIDHKSFRGSLSKLEEHSSQYLGQLETYKNVIEKVSGKRVVGCYLNYISLGCLVEVI